jgi:hypothetical protein
MDYPWQLRDGGQISKNIGIFSAKVTPPSLQDVKKKEISDAVLNHWVVIGIIKIDRKSNQNIISEGQIKMACWFIFARKQNC